MLPRTLVLVLLVIDSGILVGLLRGGRLAGLRLARLKALPLLVAALVLQLLLGLPLRHVHGTRWGIGSVLLVASLLLLLLVVRANALLPGMPLIALGLLANLLVVGLNGAMPLSTAAPQQAHTHTTSVDATHLGPHYVVAGPETHLPMLGERVGFFGVRAVVSVGDLIQYAGLFLLIQGLMVRGAARRPKPKPSPWATLLRVAWLAILLGLLLQLALLLVAACLCGCRARPRGSQGWRAAGGRHRAAGSPAGVDGCQHAPEGRRRGVEHRWYPRRPGAPVGTGDQGSGIRLPRLGAEVGRPAGLGKPARAYGGRAGGRNRLQRRVPGAHSSVGPHPAALAAGKRRQRTVVSRRVRARGLHRRGPRSPRRSRSSRRLTPRITLAKAGEQASFSFPVGVSSRPVTLTVGPLCELERGHWTCVTHNRGFATRRSLDRHTRLGEHRLVWLCWAHGPEQPSHGPADHGPGERGARPVRQRPQRGRDEGHPGHHIRGSARLHLTLPTTSRLSCCPARICCTCSRSMPGWTPRSSHPTTGVEPKHDTGPAHWNDPPSSSEATGTSSET